MTDQKLGIVALASMLALLWVDPAAARQRPGQKLEVATDVYQELLHTPDHEVPRSLIDGASCVAVIPGVIKGAFGFGGRHGNGVISCRNDAGSWGPPAFVQISGVSFGLQIGAQSSDLVLFFMNDRGVRSLLRSRFTLGGDASVAAGPVGRDAQASTDLALNAEIYAYARARGLFAGISLEGAYLAIDDTAIRRFYGEQVWPQEILFEHRVPNLPEEGRRFQEALGKE